MNTIYTVEEKAFLLKVGTKIKELRHVQELSQEAFAKKSGLDRTYISDVERGERNLSLLTLRKIAKALKISSDVLLKIN